MDIGEDMLVGMCGGGVIEIDGKVEMYGCILGEGWCYVDGIG